MSRRIPRRTILLAGLLALAKAGCTATRPRLELPADRIVERGQLVVYTNLSLTKDDPLLIELDDLRRDVANVLSLEVPRELVRVYLFESADEYDRYMKKAFPALPPRRAFFVQTESRLIVYAHKNELLQEDLRHETTHGYLHAALPRVPIWIDEGLAEFFEPPRDLAGLNRPHVKLLVAEQAAGRWTPDLMRLERATLLQEMTLLDYAESWLWVHWLARTTPEHRQALVDYVASLKEGVESTPLSTLIGRFTSNSRGELHAHLMSLEQA